MECIIIAMEYISVLQVLLVYVGKLTKTIVHSYLIIYFCLLDMIVNKIFKFDESEILLNINLINNNLLVKDSTFIFSWHFMLCTNSSPMQQGINLKLMSLLKKPL